MRGFGLVKHVLHDTNHTLLLWLKGSFIDAQQQYELQVVGTAALAKITP